MGPRVSASRTSLPTRQSWPDLCEGSGRRQGVPESSAGAPGLPLAVGGGGQLVLRPFCWGLSMGVPRLGNAGNGEEVRLQDLLVPEAGGVLDAFAADFALRSLFLPLCPVGSRHYAQISVTLVPSLSAVLLLRFHLPEVFHLKNIKCKFQK